LFLDALKQAGTARGQGCKLHIVAGSESYLPAEWQNATVEVYRAEGYQTEALAERWRNPIWAASGNGKKPRKSV
jgi:glutamate-5-semialdehyde dehydrogenase